MSESDSGVDAGCESNESNSMSVESPSHLDDEKETGDDKIPVAGPSNMNRSPFMNFQPIFCTCSYGDYQQQDSHRKMKTVLQFRHKRKVDVYNRSCNIVGERKLRKAVLDNSVEQTQKYLDCGIDPCAADEKQRTPLHFAACHGHTEIARLLLDRGADPNQRDSLGNTPLHLAVCTSNIEMVTLLLKAGTDVNAFNNSGRSPMHLAQSKLKLLRTYKAYTSHQMKSEVMRVVEMMQVYLLRSGESVCLDILNLFSSRLQQHQTREEVDTDVSDLLSSLSHLSLHKA